MVRTVLVDPSSEVQGSHNDLIANGSVEVWDSPSLKAFPPDTMGLLIEDHGKYRVDLCPTGEYDRAIPQAGTPAINPVTPKSVTGGLREALIRIGKLFPAGFAERLDGAAQIGQGFPDRNQAVSLRLHGFILPPPSIKHDARC